MSPFLGWGSGPAAGASSAGTLPAEALEAERQSETGALLWAVVLAGGIGSRFWPLSSSERPKQLLALVSDRPLIAETVARLQPLVPPDRVLVVTSRDIAPAIAAAIPEVPPWNVLVEPRPLGTAAALAWGARVIEERAGPDTIFTCVHADLAVAFPGLFRHVLREAARLAGREELLVALGVPPTRVEPAFGYLLPGSPVSADRPLSHGGAAAVRSYVEKPPNEQAEALIESGALWNAGVFVWRARFVRDELARRTPELAAGLAALDAGDHARFAAAVQSVSLERGLLERTDRLVVLPADCGWDDVGTWASLRRARELDDDGNGIHGAVHCHDATANVVHAEASTVVLYGVSGLLVVSLNGLTFVTTLDRATDLRPLLDALPREVREQPGRLGA